MDKGHWLYQPQDTWSEDEQQNESGQDTAEEQQQTEIKIKSSCAAANIINNIKKEMKEEEDKQLQEAEAEGMIEYEPPSKTWKTAEVTKR